MSGGHRIINVVEGGIDPFLVPACPRRTLSHEQVAAGEDHPISSIRGGWRSDAGPDSGKVIKLVLVTGFVVSGATNGVRTIHTITSRLRGW